MKTSATPARCKTVRYFSRIGGDRQSRSRRSRIRLTIILGGPALMKLERSRLVVDTNLLTGLQPSYSSSSSLHEPLSKAGPHLQLILPRHGEGSVQPPPTSGQKLRRKAHRVPTWSWTAGRLSVAAMISIYPVEQQAA